MQNTEDIKLYNVTDMGLGFSAMLRNFVEDSKKKLHSKIIEDIEKIFTTSTKTDFDELHAAFCIWGVDNVVLAERKRKEKIIKKSGPARYGQIAKTLDVVLKVTIYYAHLPNCTTAKRIMPLLNAALDNRMMRMLKKNYKDQLSVWPKAVEEVDEEKYFRLQEIVCQFIKEKHDDQIMPVQFDDIYWKQLNRDQ